MPDHKTYRVRQANWAEDVFGKSCSGHPYVAKPWPTGCPWDMYDFPLEGDVVVHDDVGDVTVRGMPEKQFAGWYVLVEESTGATFFADCELIPEIWEQKNTGYTGPYEVLVAEDTAIDIGGQVVNLGPGSYDIVKKGEE